MNKGIVERAREQERDVVEDIQQIMELAMDRWQARMHVQAEVMRAIERRGYRAGWRVESFLARQVAKFAEELGELAELIHPRGIDGLPMWKEVLLTAAECAKVEFDGGGQHTFGRAEVGDLEAIKGELADLQVVLFCAAQAVGELCGEGFDVIEAARQKAMGDVERGMRKADGTLVGGGKVTIDKGLNIV